MPDGTSFAYALIAGMLPSFIWLLFWLREDAHPEPRWLLLASFFGGFAAVIVAIFLEKFIADTVADGSMRYMLWALVEESLKLLAVIAIALNTAYNDEPIDAMVYAIVVALGFAALENTLFVMSPISNGQVAMSIVSDNMRFIGATLVHIVSSASVGFAMGMTFYRGRIAKFFAALAGLAVAVALHTSFNVAIVSSSEWTNTLGTFAWFWGAVVILLVLFEEVKAVRPKFG
jgi:RsiW-degrading membrane proteinase PrsW (M82 family)